MKKVSEIANIEGSHQETEPVKRICISIRQAAEMTSLSQRTVHYLIAKRILRGVKIGRRTVIPTRELEKLIK